MTIANMLDFKSWSRIGLAMLGAVAASMAIGAARADDAMPNACPVDGCTVKIIGVKKAGSELELTFEANYKPDMSKNHIHVWWGENYKVEQVTSNAETVYHVKQGEWHPTGDYPVYVTTSAASTAVRGSAKTLCVSPADRDHNILDVKIFQCLDVSEYL
jgi:hypothetical protein